MIASLAGFATVQASLGALAAAQRRRHHKEAYADLFMVSVVGPLLALVAVLAVGTTFGAF